MPLSDSEFWKAQKPLATGQTRFPWGKLQRPFCEAQMLNASLHRWQRVSFAAFERVDRTGVASFEPGELESLTPDIDRQTGELSPPKNIWRDVRNAVSHGWLAPGSSPTRLLVSPEVVEVGSARASRVVAQV